MTANNDPMNPITEDDIAHYLANTPGFFERHAPLLATVQINSPHGNRAVSLQERQSEMLREKIKVLEQRVMEMVRHGNENMVIAARLQHWALRLLQVPASEDLPATIVHGIRDHFIVPQVALRIWDMDPRYADQAFAQGVSDDIRSFSSSLMQPYCGVNAGFEAVTWLGEPASVQSVAMIPLREHPAARPTEPVSPAFGLLILASPDSQRFAAGMGTEFLERIAELASAALLRLRPA